jgi:hypothetical protein
VLVLKMEKRCCKRACKRDAKLLDPAFIWLADYSVTCPWAAADGERGIKTRADNKKKWEQ